MAKPTSSSTFSPVTRQEWRFVWIVTIAVLILTSLPYIFGYAVASPDKQFMGLMQDVPDHGGYLMWWRGFQDSLLISNRLTPEPNQPIFFNLLWWLLAQISRVTGLGYSPIYQLLRLVGGIGLFTALYRLLGVLLPDAQRRKTAFLLTSLSAGFGWLLVVAKYAAGWSELPFPQMVYNAESNYFLCVLGYPHFALAAALICLVFEFMLRGWKTGQLRFYLISGLWASVLGWMHAYDLLIIYPVAGVFFGLLWLVRRKFSWRLFWGIGIIGGLSGWAAVYSYLLTTLDPLWEEVLKQFSNAGIYTPAPPGLFVLFGLPLFLALIGLAGWLRAKAWSDERLFTAGWLGIGFLLLYIPTDFQIHMLNSWQIPMMILSASAIHDVLAPRLQPRLGVKAGQVLALLALAAVLPTNLYLWTWRFVELNRQAYPYYLETDYVKAMDWLSQNSQPDDVVLSSLTTGQYLPAMTGATAFLGHWANTVNFYDKEQRVTHFFDPAAGDAQRAQTASAFGVDYILYGPAERALGTYSPGGLNWLAPVYTSEQVTLYQVLPDRLAQAAP